MAKTANYTPEMIATITDGYKGIDNKAELAVLAEQVGKTPASVRSKLATLGLYRKPEAEKSESATQTKTQIAEVIAKEVGLNEAETEGLAKATKGALEKVVARLTNGSDEA